MPSLFLYLVSWLVPVAARARWCEEWHAELRHGGWRMLPGALPDALAMRKIGREDRRRMRGKRAGLWHAVDQDVRYAMRISVSAPGFTLAVVGSLAIGIGATTAAFTSVNAVLFRPYPKIHAQEKLVTVRVTPVPATRPSVVSVMAEPPVCELKVASRSSSRISSVSSMSASRLPLAATGIFCAVNRYLPPGCRMAAQKMSG